MKMSSIEERLAKMQPDQRRATLESLPTHLAKSGNAERFDLILKNFYFIEAKISEPYLGTQPLVEDYNLAFISELSLSESQADSLVLIKGAIQLSAHLLDRDKNQLTEQLLGRLQSFSSPEIANLLAQAKHSKATPWLRPLKTNFIPPSSYLLRTLLGHNDWVNAVAVTPDGTQIISGSEDGTLKVWDLNRGKELFTLQGHEESVNTVAVTGLQAISGAWDKTLKVWDLESKKELFSFNGHEEAVEAVAVIPGGKRVISASWDKTLKVWDLDKKEELFSLNGHEGIVFAVVVTADGKRAVSASEDRTLKVWDLTTTQELFVLQGHDNIVIAVAVTPDGSKIVSGDGDGILKVWDLNTGKELLTLNNNSDRISSIAVTPDGMKAIACSGGSMDPIASVWNLETGKKISELADHIDGICAVAITPDGKLAITGSMDNSLKVWDLTIQEKLSTLQADRLSASIATPNEQRDDFCWETIATTAFSASGGSIGDLVTRLASMPPDCRRSTLNDWLFSI